MNQAEYSLRKRYFVNGSTLVLVFVRQKLSCHCISLTNFRPFSHDFFSYLKRLRHKNSSFPKNGKAHHQKESGFGLSLVSRLHNGRWDPAMKREEWKCIVNMRLSGGSLKNDAVQE